MKRIYATQSVSRSHLASGHHASAHTAYVEHEIIEMQELLLTKGFHELWVADMDEGRKTVHQFLAALSCYEKIAVLTTSEYAEIEIESFLHLYPLIAQYTHEYELNAFLNVLHIDFLLIEEDAQMQQEAWFSLFKHKLKQYQLDRHFPVVTMKQQV
jgi:hypothetical protein